MKFSQFILIPIIISALAFTIQLVDQSVAGLMPIPANKGFGWVAFICWSLYFLAGGDLAGGRKVLFACGVGIAASVAIMELSGVLGSYLSAFATPAAIFAIVIPCLCLERLPPFDFIPGIFVGAGIYFGMMSYVPGATYANAAITELAYAVIGVFYGWLSLVLRGKYTAAVEKNALSAGS